MPYEVPRDIAAPLSYSERIGGSAIADGVRLRCCCEHVSN